MKLLRNTGAERVIDLVRPWAGSGSQLDIVTSALSLFAFAEVLGEVSKLALARLLLPSDGTDLALLGNAADRGARNRVQSRWLAKHGYRRTFRGRRVAVMMADVDEPTDAAFLADKLIDATSEPFLVQGNDISTGVSIGICVFGTDQPDAETMLSRADLALYRAKSEGLGGFRFFADAMDIEVRARVTLSSELREAIAARQLFLMCQPQVEIATGRITGVEALVRWRHPTRGVLGPGVFIPAAEKSGLVAALGHWVLSEACRQAGVWLGAGVAPEVIAVNLSAVQFKRSFELEKDIVGILAESGLPAERLELELTETVLMTASHEHNEVLERLRETGVGIAIDDFGVGYSSLDYLRRFPVDRIKIAQDFVEHIATVSGSAAIVRATIGLLANWASTSSLKASRRLSS